MNMGRAKRALRAASTSTHTMELRLTPPRAPSVFRRTLTRALCARPYATIVTFFALFYLPGIASLPLDGTLEGNRVEVAREMLRSGDWIVPRLGGALYLAKPPFHPWTLAALSAPLGDVSLAVSRCLSAATVIATCCLVFRWGNRELGRRTGLFAALALGSSALVWDKAMRAELESELALLAALALFGFFESARSRDRSRALRLCLGAGLALGAAFLTKGPPVLIVFLATVLTLSVCVRHRAWLRTSASTLAVALACGIAWLVPVTLRLGTTPLITAFHEQFAERVVRAGRTNVEPFWFYLPALLVALLPASLLATCLALVVPQHVSGARARERAVFLWGWALIPLLLFSVSSGKETRYLLPMLPAWTLLLAWGWTRARRQQRSVRWRRVLARACSLFFWVAPMLWALAGWQLFADSRPLVLATAFTALACRAALEWSARTGHSAVVFGVLVCGVVTAKLAWAGTILAKQQRAIPVETVAELLTAHLAEDEAWILVGPYRSWWDFSVNRPCVTVPDWNALRTHSAPGARVILSLASSIPEHEPGLLELGQWDVDGDVYRLVARER